MLFEYGTGSSTLFWARRTGRVCAVEHDRSWHDRVWNNLPANVQLLYRPSEGARAYINAILECNETFDIIVVDGLHRAECLKIAPVKLSPGGVVILDDSDRRAWREGVEHLLRLGFRQLRFAGLKPTGFHADETSVFYRNDNCLGI